MLLDQNEMLVYQRSILTLSTLSSNTNLSQVTHTHTNTINYPAVLLKSTCEAIPVSPTWTPKIGNNLPGCRKLK